MKEMQFRELYCPPARYWTGLAGLAILMAMSFGTFLYLEHEGHWVTGMNNQVIWGLPHVFAIFLIVAASGALNVASIGSVFGGPLYKPLGRYSGLLAISLLIGGLLVLVLDLGRPERLIVAMTTYNFKSIFAWNIFLYTGFIVITLVYLWAMMERQAKTLTRPIGFVAFFWRLLLTTGTGSIFGFIVARDAYNSAVLAPMFIIMSFSYGLAFFIITLMSAYLWGDRKLGDLRLAKLKNLLGVFVGAVLFFNLVYHLTNLYIVQQHGIERFILLDGGPYTAMFWLGQILIGSIFPLVLIYAPKYQQSRYAIATASMLILVGGFCQIYVLLIGGQAYPLSLFPGYEVLQSSFYDGVVAAYSPSFWEAMLGIGGIAVALALVSIGARMLKVFPESLEDPDSLGPAH